MDVLARVGVAPSTMNIDSGSRKLCEQFRQEGVSREEYLDPSTGKDAMAPASANFGAYLYFSRGNKLPAAIGGSSVTYYSAH